MEKSALFCLRLIGLSLILTLLVLAAPAPAAAQDPVSDLLGRINSLRASQGLHAYSLNGALNAAAQGHAQWMADSQMISHTGPSGSTPTMRAAAAGYPSSFVSENIYGGSNAGVDTAWTFWINSPIHYRGLINAGYTEVGIGVGQSSWGRTYVLVFGSQNNPYVAAARAANAGDGGGNGGAEAAPPSFIVGVDGFGNIMHEVQPGQTLGDIALTYGYTWDDLPGMLNLNQLTEQDIRLIQVGQIFLVPPHAGTYTPTPLPPGVTLTASHTPDPTTPTPESPDQGDPLDLPSDGSGPQGDPPPSEQPSGEQPTITPTYDLSILTQIAIAKTDTALTPVSLPTEVVAPQIATAASIPINLPDYVVTPSPSPTTDPALIAAGIDVTAVQVAQVSVASAAGTVPQQVIIVRESSTSPWLIAAVVLQGLIIIAASIEFFRRLRSK